MIVSRHNQRLKEMRRLKAGKTGKGGDLALLEGPHLISEAVSLGLELPELLATPEFLETGPGKRLGSVLPYPPIEVTASLLEEIADADSPRGVVATAILPRQRLKDFSKLEPGPGVFAEGIQDPGNLGALARAAEAAGARTLVLSDGCVHPNHPRAMRASAGSLLRLVVAVGGSLAHAHRLAPNTSFVALVPRGGRSLYELGQPDGDGNLWLAVGAEGAGLSRETRKACDLEVTIPLAAPVESLNTAVAAAVALFELRRTRS